MEENKLVNLAVDSLWYLTKEQVDYFNKKITLTFTIYSEILANRKDNKSMSDRAKKILFQNIILVPFASAKEGIDMATLYNLNDGNVLFDKSKLNMRGLARSRIIMGIVNNEIYDRKKNNDLHYAVSSALQAFTLKNTEFSEKSLFEIIIDFINSRPQLYDGDEKMVANSLINSPDYAIVINRLNDSFEKYIAKLILKYESEVRKQGSSKLTYEIPSTIYKKLSTQYNRYDFNSEALLSSDYVQNIINSFVG